MATLLAALSVCLSALPLWWSAAALAVIALVSFRGYQTLKQQPEVRFLLAGGRVYLLSDEAGQPPVLVSIRRSWHLSAWLFQLQYRPLGQRRWKTLLVWPDSACAETRRILRSHDALDFSRSDRDEAPV